jgi:hypothetical protein
MFGIVDAADSRWSIDTSSSKEVVKFVARAGQRKVQVTTTPSSNSFLKARVEIVTMNMTGLMDVAEHETWRDASSSKREAMFHDGWRCAERGSKPKLPRWFVGEWERPLVTAWTKKRREIVRGCHFEETRMVLMWAR